MTGPHFPKYVLTHICPPVHTHTHTPHENRHKTKNRYIQPTLQLREKISTPLQVFKLTGSLFHSLMALKLKAKRVKAEHPLGILQPPLEAVLEALHICSEGS